MKLAWLEDFLTLIETGTFSRAAQARNVTQPAFSRRIQMLEQWFGTQLVERRSHRLALTAAAKRHEAEIRRLVAAVYELRSRMQAEAEAHTRITLTTQHTLMVSHLPRLLALLQAHQPETAFTVRTGNLEECLGQMARGEADLMLRFESDDAPPQEQPPELQRLVVGYERLVPVTACGADGEALFDLERQSSVRLLNYPEDSFLGGVVRRECLPGLVREYSIDSACESAFTVGLKEMALAGMGVAWLPHGLIERDLQAGRLRSLQPLLGSPRLVIALCTRGAGLPGAVAELWERLCADPPRL
jgi:DNA-binding transcriptional LysR family regulator